MFKTQYERTLNRYKEFHSKDAETHFREGVVGQFRAYLEKKKLTVGKLTENLSDERAKEIKDLYCGNIDINNLSHLLETLTMLKIAIHPDFVSYPSLPQEPEFPPFDESTTRHNGIRYKEGD